MHLESTVVGDIRPEQSAYDVLVATFPAGTLSGAPKPRAMALIDELEPSRRGIYGGVVGYLDFHGDLDMAIAIRTAVIKGGRAYVQAGGGIVADSVPRSGVRGERQQGRGGPAGRGLGLGAAVAMIEALTSKRIVLVLVLGAASVILVSGSREWVSGSVDDAVLGASALHGKGSDIAPGALAAALVGLASAVAAATSGTVVRVVAACAALLAAVLGALRGHLGPGRPRWRAGQAGGRRHGPQRDRSRPRSGRRLGLGCARRDARHGGRVGWARWSADGAGADSPAGMTHRSPGTGHRPGSPGARARARPDSAWDQLSRGEDPTADR